VIDHLDGDAASRRLFERSGHIAVQRRPGIDVDFSLERRLERLVRVVRAQEIRLTDEEALLVVVRV
jgi:hypothetical protein